MLKHRYVAPSRESRRRHINELQFFGFSHNNEWHRLDGPSSRTIYIQLEKEKHKNGFNPAM